mgnify:CR=1 FL=1
MSALYELLGEKPQEKQQELESTDLVSKLSPFDFLNTINVSKKNLILESECPDLIEKQYNAWMVNRGLSFFEDTVHLANFMNRNHHLDKKLQYDFFLNTVRPKKRWSKWFKKTSDDNIDIVQKAYGYSYRKAETALSLLSTEQIGILKQKQKQGGLKK